MINGVLVGKPEGKRPLGRPGRRWMDNIRTDLQEVGCGYMDWIGLVQLRTVDVQLTVHRDKFLQ